MEKSVKQEWLHNARASRCSDLLKTNEKFRFIFVLSFLFIPLNRRTMVVSMKYFHEGCKLLFVFHKDTRGVSLSVWR